MEAVERFRAAAATHGIDPDVRRFPAGTRTAADAAAAIGCPVAAIVKSLVFMAADETGSERAVLVLTSGANRVDTALAAGLLGAARVRRADADEVRASTGFAIGGTPPFGHATATAVLVDEDLLALGEVWAAAGAPDAVWSTTPDVLVEVTGGTVGAVASA